MQVVVIDGCVHCSSECVLSLAANCRRLHTLSTAKCYKVTDRALTAYALPGYGAADNGGGSSSGSSGSARLTLRSLCLRQSPKVCRMMQRGLLCHAKLCSHLQISLD